MGLIQRDVQILDQLVPAHRLALEQFGELRRRVAHRLDAEWIIDRLLESQRTRPERVGQRGSRRYSNNPPERDAPAPAGQLASRKDEQEQSTGKGDCGYKGPRCEPRGDTLRSMTSSPRIAV